VKPKWMNKEESYRQKSDKRVTKIAKNSGGHVTPNSGATPFRKGDISYPAELLEHKMTAKQSFKLNKADLHKIYSEALRESKEPVFMIDFGDIVLIGQVKKLHLK
jgi:hypothetical protein